MKIDFTKQLAGDKELGDYFVRGEPNKDMLVEGSAFYSKITSYDLRQLESDLVDQIEEQLTEGDLDTYRTSHTNLFVQRPNQFALELHAENGLFLPNKYEELEKITEGRWRKRERRHYQEIPQVQVTGRIDYDQSFGNSPGIVLETLEGLAYTSIVTTTLRQVETMLDTLTVSVPELSKRQI